jgi:hypothetical protein
MKTIPINIQSILLSIMVFAGFSFYGQTEEDLVIKIEDRFKTTDANLNMYDMIEKEIYGESTEGGLIRMYLDDGETVLMHCEFYDMYGNIKEDYYFLNRQLYFVYTVKEEYSDPAYGEGMYVTETLENLYYFSDSNMIRWIDNNSLQVEKNSDSFLDTEQFLLRECVRLTEIFNSQE